MKPTLLLGAAGTLHRHPADAVCIGAISNQKDPEVSGVMTPFKMALIVCMAAAASFLSKSLVSSVSYN